MKTPSAFTVGNNTKLRLGILLSPAPSVIVLGGNGATAAEKTGPRKVRMAFISLSSVMCRPRIAREAGIFNKHGLDAEAIASVKRDNNLALKVMGKYLHTTNLAALAESYDTDAQ